MARSSSSAAARRGGSVADARRWRGKRRRSLSTRGAGGDELLERQLARRGREAVRLSISSGRSAEAALTLPAASRASCDRLSMLSASFAAAMLVGDLPHRGERGVDVVDGAAGCAGRRSAPRTSASEALTEAGQVRHPSLWIRASMPSTSAGAGGDELLQRQRARLRRQRLDLVDQRRHAVGGGADAGDGEAWWRRARRARLATSCASVAWSTSARTEARIAASCAGASWMPDSSDDARAGRRSAPEVLRRRAHALVGDQRVDVGEQRTALSTSVLERQVRRRAASRPRRRRRCPVTSEGAVGSIG